MPDETRHESADLEDYSVQEPADSLTGEPGAPGDDPLDRGVAPPERWSAGVKFGSTADEQASGESLDQLLAEEEPDTAFDTDNEPPEDSDDDDEADEYLDGLLLDDGPDPRAAGWWPRMRAPTLTTRRISSPATSASTAAPPARKKPRSTWWRTTTPTSALATDGGAHQARRPMGFTARGRRMKGAGIPTLQGGGGCKGE